MQERQRSAPIGLSVAAETTSGTADMRRIAASYIVFAAIAACTTLPAPKFVSADHHPVIGRDASTNVLVDVCVKYDTVVDSNAYFLIDDSRKLAKGIVDSANRYLLSAGIAVATSQAPFVCGATHDVSHSAQKIAAQPDTPASSSVQPFDVVPGMGGDTEYVEALRIVSTYVFAHAHDDDGKPLSGNIFSTSTPYSVSSSALRSAASVVSRRLGATNLLYVGMTATRPSKEKVAVREAMAYTAAAVLAAGKAAANTQTVMTPGGHVTRVGFGSAIVQNPPRGVKIHQVIAGLIDLKTQELVWSNSIKPTPLSDFDTLLLGIAHTTMTQWTPPGTPQRAPPSAEVSSTPE
jgi:hypothetical protein